MAFGAPFIHHIALFASNFAISEGVYTAALRELDIEALFRTADTAEYWLKTEDRLSFSLEQAPRPDSVTRGFHMAFAARDRNSVHRFHDAAVSNGAQSTHAPRFWPEYRAYCAFLHDPDGNNIEAVHKETSP
jgi:catechol 2,3-dioxygenase-like lactoylglutathione lyase family enzyme